MPRELSALFDTEEQIHELPSTVMLQSGIVLAPSHSSLRVPQGRGCQNFRLLGDWTADSCPEDAALFIGPAALLVAAAELQGNGTYIFNCLNTSLPLLSFAVTSLTGRLKGGQPSASPWPALLIIATFTAAWGTIREPSGH